MRWDRGGIRLGSPNINNARPGRPYPVRHNSLGAGLGSMSDDSDAGEVLPTASGSQTPSGRPLTAEMGADGKWFTALDERYGKRQARRSSY